MGKDQATTIVVGDAGDLCQVVTVGMGGWRRIGGPGD